MAETAALHAKLEAQLEARAQLLAEREAEQAAVEERQLRAFKEDALRQITAAQSLLSRRAVALAKKQLLQQCWRALCLHTASNQMIADRRQFRELLQQKESAGGPRGSALKPSKLPAMLR